MLQRIIRSHGNVSAAGSEMGSGGPHDGNAESKDAVIADKNTEIDRVLTQKDRVGDASASGGSDGRQTRRVQVGTLHHCL